MSKVWVEAKRRIFIDTKYSRAGCMIENKYFTFSQWIIEKTNKNNYNEYNNRNKQYVPTV